VIGGRRGRYEAGLPAAELWGVGRGPRPDRNRSPEAKARRAAKAAAKRMGMLFKAYLRMVAKRTEVGNVR